jgi:curved DNA-binding protein CbpA
MNLPANATKELIRERYRELAKLYHPDRSRVKSKTAEEMMKKLNEAKDYFGAEVELMVRLTH